MKKKPHSEDEVERKMFKVAGGEVITEYGVTTVVTERILTKKPNTFRKVA